MTTLNIQQLRDKYRRIIEGQDSEEQADQIKKSLTYKKNTGQVRFLTEHNENLSAGKGKENSANTVFLALKERIAQGVHNLAEKENEIANHKEEITKQKIQIAMLEQQLSFFKANIQENCTKIVQEKVNSSSLEREVEKLKGIIQDLYVDKDLVFKQIQFYKKQIKDLKTDKKNLSTKLQQQHKQMQIAEKTKYENNRLRENLKRMQLIINECCQEKVNIDLTDKHYLGKPIKEANCWFSQNLVGEVESFLRKWQIGLHNKEFIDSLVKFIDQYKRSADKPSSLTKLKAPKSMHKKRDSKHHITSSDFYLDISTSNKSRVQGSLKKSILLNKYKKRTSKAYTQSLFESDKEATTAKVYEQILEQYHNALTEVLKENEIKPKKILMLSEELKANVCNFLDETKANMNK